MGGHPWLSDGDLRTILPGEGTLDDSDLQDFSLSVADCIVIATAYLSFLTGLVIPLVFGILATLHGNAYTGLILLAFTFTGVLPLGSFYVTGLVGFRGLSQYRRLIEDEIVNMRKYDYVRTYTKFLKFKIWYDS